MSIGNLKDYGNKGNNFPYQKAVLKGLSLGKLGELKELITSESNVLDLQTNIDALFANYPNAYLVSKSIVYDGTDYTAFITVKLA
jgi:hypothetical protein